MSSDDRGLVGRSGSIDFSVEILFFNGRLDRVGKWTGFRPLILGKKSSTRFSYSSPVLIFLHDDVYSFFQFPERDIKRSLTLLLLSSRFESLINSTSIFYARKNRDFKMSSPSFGSHFLPLLLFSRFGCYAASHVVADTNDPSRRSCSQAWILSAFTEIRCSSSFLSFWIPLIGTPVLHDLILRELLGSYKPYGLISSLAQCRL